MKLRVSLKALQGMTLNGFQGTYRTARAARTNAKEPFWYFSPTHRYVRGFKRNVESVWHHVNLLWRALVLGVLTQPCNHGALMTDARRFNFDINALKRNPIKITLEEDTSNEESWSI